MEQGCPVHEGFTVVPGTKEGHSSTVQAAGVKPPCVRLSHPTSPHLTPRYTPLLGEIPAHTDTKCQVAHSSDATAPLSVRHCSTPNAEVTGPLYSQGAGARSPDISLPPSQRYETHRHSAWQERRCKTIPSQLAEDRQPRVAFSCTTPKAQEHVGNTDSLVLSKMPPWL